MNKNICGNVISSEATDAVCIAHPNHAGAHQWVDAMGFGGIDKDRKPVYRDGFNFAR